jgi:hypothetical protein
MPVVMRVMGCVAGWHLGEMEGWYIHYVDVQAAATSIDWLQLTEDLKDAWVWDSIEEATETWREILMSDPVRPDGKPNRPLSAFTIEFRKLEDNWKERILK